MWRTTVPMSSFNICCDSLGGDLMFPWLRRILVLSIIWFAACLYGATTSVDMVDAGRQEFLFGDMLWRVKSSTVPVAPGPNYFSSGERSVWMDERGLHLTIAKSDDRWYATEVFTKQRVGYGTYTFSVESDVRSYDPAVVAGFFTWDTAPIEHNREIDIEFAAWGEPDGTKFQYVVQPYTSPERIEVFDPKLQGDSTTHRIIWLPDRLEFFSYHGPVDPDDPDSRSQLMHHWVFAGTPPTEGRVRFRMNLWLFQGMVPQQPVEMVVTSFRYDRWEL